MLDMDLDPQSISDPGAWARLAARFWGWFMGTPLQSLIAVLVGLLLLAAARWVIRRVVRSIVDGGMTVRQHAGRLLSRTGLAAQSDPLIIARRVQRAETMGSVLRSAAGLVIAILVLTALANIHDWDLGPLLASAGVAGVALGFGAQTLVKDFLSGLFMLVEDQYGVGDVVDLGEASGVVEAIGLRVTQVRDLSGTLWYVRNGEVMRVGNMTQGWSKAFIEVLVTPDADVPRAIELMRTAAAEVADDDELGRLLLADAEVTGYEDLTAESVRLRLMVKTAPAQQWRIQRVLRRHIRDLFAAEGIPLALERREVLVEREFHRHDDPAADEPADDDATGDESRT
ncbi:mechanosensitive ion channel protein MscS [Cellulomonas bogoriensis 69B4 = DSM 16987]|uniref:Mechanosensitive ion channel protein MscS n=1 Tax=Cellulomonas bogoriensis 69B4 = DSM 16987 TaxID=1386082 RepID=A0A0A0BWV1_9CELL|nr:mechanosensitive ion channel protein MscS [Cellulomonas bogoriensis 69B4 = DSM 16987]